MNARAVAVIAAAAWACARPVQIASSPLVPAVRDPGPPADYSPRTAGVITLLSIELPEPGTIVGGHYQGVQYDRLRGTITLAAGTRERWMESARAAGDSVLIGQGFRVQIPGPPTSDAEPMQGVRFGLAATVTMMDLKEIGYVEPFVVDATARVAWELLDLSSGASVFEGTSTGAVRANDSIEMVVPRVIAAALARLVEQPAFQRAVMSPRPLHAQDLFMARFERTLPQAGEAVPIARAAQNMNAETGVLGGVVVLNGSRGFATSAVVLSRDGLALAPADAARQRWIWSRNFEGRTRAARVLRTSGEIALVELSCPEGCETVLWDADTSLADRTRVVWVGGRSFMRNASMGVVYAWKSLRVRRDRDGVLTWRTTGRPAPVSGAGVARADGIVVGLATRTGVVPIARALKDLGVEVQGTP